MDVVWLKRDARLRDHGPLTEVLLGAGGSHFALLYIYEPSQLQHKTVHGSHLAFANEGLRELDARLQELLHGPAAPAGIAAQQAAVPARAAAAAGELAVITTLIGEAVDELSRLHSSEHGPVRRLLSHQETGHLASYGRDRAVRRWCKAHDVVWVEYEQNGVSRGLRSRADTDGKAAQERTFAARWTKFMAAPQHPDPAAVQVITQRSLHPKHARMLCSSAAPDRWCAARSARWHCAGGAARAAAGDVDAGRLRAAGASRLAARTLGPPP